MSNFSGSHQALHGGLFFVDFYLQQIEVHKAGIERQTAYADTHILGFQSLVGNKIAEAVLLVVVKRFGTVEGIDDEETAPRAVVGADEHFDEVHDGCSVALTCEVAAGSETADEYGGETLEGLVAQVGVVKELLFVFVSDAVGQSDAVVGKRESGDDGVGLTFETEQIGLAEQPALVDETILGEEFIKVSFATTEWLALGEFLLRGSHKVTLRQQVFYGHRAVQVFRKSETTFASWR